MAEDSVGSSAGRFRAGRRSARRRGRRPPPAAPVPDAAAGAAIRRASARTSPASCDAAAPLVASAASAPSGAPRRATRRRGPPGDHGVVRPQPRAVDGVVAHPRPRRPAGGEMRAHRQVGRDGEPGERRPPRRGHPRGELGGECAPVAAQHPAIACTSCPAVTPAVKRPSGVPRAASSSAASARCTSSRRQSLSCGRAPKRAATRADAYARSVIAAPRWGRRRRRQLRGQCRRRGAGERRVVGGQRMRRVEAGDRLAGGGDRARGPRGEGGPDRGEPALGALGDRAGFRARRFLARRRGFRRPARSARAPTRSASRTRAIASTAACSSARAAASGHTGMRVMAGCSDPRADTTHPPAPCCAAARAGRLDLHQLASSCARDGLPIDGARGRHASPRRRVTAAVTSARPFERAPHDDGSVALSVIDLRQLRRG